MPSCSNSSNLSSAINSLNISQGSGGSRFIVQINNVAGLTVGNVIRYDVPTSGYTASKADTPEHAEVFGIIESYSATTNKLNVVMGGSVLLDSAKFATIATDPTGAGGGNDIYFLSGTTAGVLQNLAPTDVDHITKPVYQVAPHGTYSGSVINYSGYRLGGDIEASLDTVNLLARVGSVQFAFDIGDIFHPEELKLRQYGFNFTGPGLAPIFQLDATTQYNWKLEHIRMDSDYVILRYIDFPEVSTNVLPVTNGGWIERIKVDTGVTIDRATVRGKVIQQFGHSQYQTNTASATWYGTIVDYDSTSRYLYVQRPARLDTLLTNLFDLMAETDKPLKIFTSETNPQLPNSASNSTIINITTTNTAIQFFGFITPMIKLMGEFNGTNYPFYFQSLYDPFNENVQETVGVNTKIFMKIKNRGVSLVIPDNITATEVAATSITLSSQDLQTIIADLTARIACLENPANC